MPEVVIDFITSLDGYGAAEGWPGWWGMEGPEYLTWLDDQPEADYTVLMGATTYRVMSGLATEGEPGTEALAGLSKVVFSSTLTEPLSWPNTQLVRDDPVVAVREMKDAGAKSMRTIGSLTLCRSLLRAGLVDRFRVVVFPSSPEAPVRSGSTTATQMSHSRWSTATPSTDGCSYSSMSPRSWLDDRVHQARQLTSERVCEHVSAAWSVQPLLRSLPAAMGSGRVARLFW